MLNLIFAFGIVAVIVLATEMLWRNRILERESGRKIVHVLVGSWVALWPLFLSFDEIKILGILLLLGIIFSRTLKIFQAIHNVKRITIGEIFFPIAIILSALLTDSPWIFSVSMLELGIADGIASVVGGRSRRTTFDFFGQRKSISGSIAFWTASLVIIGCIGNTHGITITSTIVVATIVTITELASPFGLDDLTVPLMTILLLNSV